ncbi:DNA polymerase III subunit delta [Brachybacterium sp. GPGPB12]|uniref:DNA polymerase III subunit delta n=1 Tax=Brachybacterium sp. GPGPB12 TaxID=3023517 RepID=UPI0031344166
MSDVEWHSVALAPIVLVHGTEGLIADRAVRRLRALAKEADPSVEVHDLSGEALGPGALAQVASPSLFGEPRLVVVPEPQSAPDSLVLEPLDYVKAPEQGVTLVLVHRGGNRGKKLLDALKKAGVPRVDASPVKRAADKQAFVAAEFARARRRIQPDALVALVDAFGTDLAELAAISRQLIEDTTPDPGERPGQVTVAEVHALTSGRVESTAFAVADAAIAGKEQDALQPLQQAQPRRRRPRPDRRRDRLEGPFAGEGVRTERDPARPRHARLDLRATSPGRRRAGTTAPWPGRSRQWPARTTRSRAPAATRSGRCGAW